MYIDNENYPIDLMLHKVYKVLTTEKEAQHGWVRVIDETSEDYLYESYHFVPVQIPAEAEPSFELATA